MGKLFTDTNKIDFDYILEKVAEYARSSSAKEALLHSEPQTDVSTIRYAHASVGECIRFFQEGGTLDFPEFTNFYEYILEIEKGITLESERLYALAHAVTLYFSTKEAFDEDRYPLVSSYFTVEKPGTPVYREIMRHIRADGYVESSASKALHTIRDRIAETMGRSEKAVDSFYRDMKRLNYSADDLVSVRDGFQCVAVKTNYKGMVDGVVIDYSNTGQTAFVVPESVFQLTAELNHLHAEEHAEIRRILKSYCDSLVNVSHELVVIDRELKKFDLLHARARFAVAYECATPEINESGFLRIVNGRHPMLGTHAVPLTIELDQDNRILVITGPNAGGKTVVIKTVGLFLLMVQCGIPVPASPDSSFSPVHSMFIDIGDDQSITDSLSTFSGHIKRLKFITDTVAENDLVLIDELGSGTDPVEGEALALSVIEYLLKTGCRAIISTHYSGIKHFASSTPGVGNASMEYDDEQLSPTYRLRLGIPGSSRAFDISVRMGLDPAIIERARNLLDRDFIRTEETIKSLEKERLAMSENVEKLKSEIEEYKAKQAEVDILIERYRNSDRELKRMISDKKMDFLKESRRMFERIVREVRESGAAKNEIKKGQAFFDTLETELSTDMEPVPQNSGTKFSFSIGDDVIHRDNNIKGTIVEVKNGVVTVQFGAVRMQCQPENLVMSKPASQINYAVSAGKSAMLNESHKRELDLRGQRYEEALRSMELFMDQAVAGDIREIRIIHGVGSGAIRKCIQDFLHSSPYVEHYEYEKIGEYKMNYGVTVATLMY